MSQNHQSPQPKFEGIEVEGARNARRRRYPKNSESLVITQRPQFKIIQLDEQILASPTSASIVNLQFGEETTALFRRPANHKHNKKVTLLSEERKASSLHREMKNRYHELFKESMDCFSRNSMQIGPCLFNLNKEHQLNDPYCTRKLMNIEKLTFPFRETKKELTSRYKCKSLMNRTSRIKVGGKQLDKRNLSVLEQQRRTISQKYQGEDRSLIDEMALTKREIRLGNKERSALIPVRKPSTRKDYFVFGLSDRNGPSENRIQMYRDLLWKVNYSNGLFVCTPSSLPSPYKFYVGEGNNSNLIRGLVRRRFWWALASQKNQEGINFSWTQLKVNTIFLSQQNGRMPEHLVIERIQSESASIKAASSGEDGDDQAQRKIFGRVDYKIWRNHMMRNGKTEKRISEGTYQKRVIMYEKKRMGKIEDSRGLIVHNHLESNFYIGNKKALFYNLKRYLQLKGENPFRMLPITFHLAKGMEDPKYQQFVRYYDEMEEERKTNRNMRNIWIVKPGETTNRGNGITVCYSLDDIKVRLKGKEKNGDGKLRTFIIQKYIENPFLYNRRKFDIRHYMLMTCMNGSYKGYWYEEGYIRTSSSEFNLRQSRDPLIHLTNDAIQKHTAQYGKYEKANKLSYTDFQKYLDAAYPTKRLNFFEQVLPKMKSYAAQSIKSTYLILDPNRKRCNFQLFGLDFMIDQDFHPWLIQVNTNPCLELCCPLLSRIIPAVVENMLKICLDPLFPPPENWPSSRKPFFGEDPLGENKFQIIFDEASDGKEVESLYQGQSKIDLSMGKIEQENQTFENDGEEQWQNGE